VTSVLRQAVYRGQITLEEGEEAVSAFFGMGIRMLSAETLTERAWNWGKMVNAARLYDMYYVAAADLESSVLWTLDRRLVNLVAGRANFVQWAGEAQPEAAEATLGA
jgi:predicted nucleic acid-binding protein